MSQMTLCLITVISFVWGKLTLGTTAMCALLAFFFTGILDAQSVLACFSNATGIMMVSMFIVAAGFNKTQFVKNVAGMIGHAAKGTLIAQLLCFCKLPEALLGGIDFLIVIGQCERRIRHFFPQISFLCRCIQLVGLFIRHIGKALAGAVFPIVGVHLFHVSLQGLQLHQLFRQLLHGLRIIAGNSGIVLRRCCFALVIFRFLLYGQG